MLRSSVSRLAAGGLVCLLMASGAAPRSRAQDEPERPQDEESQVLVPAPVVAPPSGIEAIEVTGERLDEANVQDEAQAITAFSGADLDRASIVNVDSLAFSVPGLHVGQSAQAPIITLRGIGTENASLTGEPGVSFHVDGLNISRPAAARVAFFDLETLDVKRGPQGLLGGKNSTSGSINLLSKKPHDEFEVAGDVLFGNYDRVRWRGVVNVPFGEYVATRVALYSEQRDGFLDNKYVSDSRDPFDSDDFGGRTHLKVSPADGLELMFSYNYFKQDGNGPQADAVPIPRKIWPEHLGLDAQGRPPAGFIAGCPDSPTPVATVLPLASACFQQQFREPVSVPGRTSILPNGDLVTGRAILLPDGSIRVRPLGSPTRIVTGTRRSGQPFQTQPFTLVREGSHFFAPPFVDETFHPEVLHWNPATEDSDPRSIYADEFSAQRNRYWGWSTGMDWDVPGLPLFGETHLKLVGGFQKTDGTIDQDFDATDASVSTFTTEDQADQYGGDLQWSGTGLAERLEWQLSLFHTHEKASRDIDAPGLNGNISGGLVSEQTTDNKAYGAALHGRFSLTDALSGSLGGRYVKDRKATWMLRDAPGNLTEGRFRGCTGNLELVGVPPQPRDNPGCEEIFRGTMWGTGLEWRPFGDDHLLYARMDRGYKSGGFSATTVGDYKPERIWAYALGTKSEFFDQRLRLNLEGFFYSYQDMQLVILDGLALRTENSDARMYGWDLEAVSSPVEGLSLSSVVSFLKTETLDYLSLDPTLEPPGGLGRISGYAQWHSARLNSRDLADENAAEGRGGPTYAEMPTCLEAPDSLRTVACGEVTEFGGLDDFSGNELSRSPRWKVTLSAEYEIPLGRFGSLTPRVQYSWQDDTYFRAFNRDFDLQEDYHLTDAKLVWNSPESRWSVEAFVQNIEDEAPKQNILIGPRQFGSAPLAWYGPPRFYGVQVGFKY